MKRFNEMSLRHKMLVLFLVASMIPLLIVSFSMIQIFRTTFEKQTVESMFDNSKLIINQTEGLFTEMVNCSNAVTFGINRVIDDYETKDDYSAIEYEMAIKSVLYNNKILYPEASAIAYLDLKGHFYTSDEMLYEDYTKVYTTEMMKEIAKTTGKSSWFDFEVRDYLTTSHDEPVMTLGKKVIHIKNGKTLGYFFLILEENTLSQIFKDQIIAYEVVSQETVVSSANKDHLMTLFHEKLQSDNEFLKISDENQELIYIFKEMGPNAPREWTLVGQTKVSDFKSEIMTTVIIISWIAIIGIVIEMFVANVYSSIITRPIEALVRQMEFVGQGHFDVEIQVKSEDEIGSLTNHFNDMSQNIQRLIIDNRQKEEKKREYELKLLQEQVKPHFLYNVLDTIYVTNDMNMKRETAKGIKALADFYRNTLSNGSEYVDVSVEIQGIREYLTLITLQYGDIFDYEIQVDPHVMSLRICKLVLQPLVENAIYHGLKPLNAYGHLEIHVGQATIGEVTYLKMTVKDNGVGMNQTKLNDLKHVLEGRPKEGFGLFTIKDRLKLVYGDSAQLLINAIENVGTEITLLIEERLLR